MQVNIVCYVELSMSHKFSVIVNKIIRHRATLEAALQENFLFPLFSVCEAVWNTPFSFGCLLLEEVGRSFGEGLLGGLAKW